MQFVLSVAQRPGILTRNVLSPLNKRSISYCSSLAIRKSCLNLTSHISLNQKKDSFNSILKSRSFASAAANTGKKSDSAADKAKSAASQGANVVVSVGVSAFNFTGSVILTLANVTLSFVNILRSSALVFWEMSSRIIREHKISLELSPDSWSTAWKVISTNLWDFYKRGPFDYTWEQLVNGIRTVLGLFVFYVFGRCITRIVHDVEMQLRIWKIYQERKAERLKREASGITAAPAADEHGHDHGHGHGAATSVESITGDPELDTLLSEILTDAPKASAPAAGGHHH